MKHIVAEAWASRDGSFWWLKMMHVTLKDGRMAHVCCSVFHMLQDRKMIKEK